MSKKVARSPGPRLRGLFTTPAGLLALALLTVELVAGVQTYVTSTVTPLAAADLHGRSLYGFAQGANQVGMFLTLPLGAYLAERFSRSRLLLVFTGVAIVGAVIGAAAPSMGWYAAGRGVTGLASGALATIAMNLVATSLPSAWRRFVLAGYAGTWVMTSLVGPVYAAWISALVGWRWTMILYLPVLVAARFLVAGRIPMSTAGDAPEGRLKVRESVGLAIGIALVSATGVRWMPRLAIALVGAATVLFATRSLLPPGTFTMRRGRPAAVALLGILTGVYFGASAVIAIVGHDGFGLDSAGIGLLLTLGGLGWAITGILCGRRPSPDDHGLVMRVRCGAALLGVSLVLVALAPLTADSAVSLGILFVGWSAAGVGMGLCYLELLNRIVSQPRCEDGITAAQAASAAVIVEMITTALATTATASAVSAGAATTVVYAALALGAALLAVLAVWALRRVEGSRGGFPVGSRMVPDSRREGDEANTRKRPRCQHQ